MVRYLALLYCIEQVSCIPTDALHFGTFLSEQERKLSRLPCTLPPAVEGEDTVDPFNYEPNLYLQGFVVVSTSNYI